MIILPYWSLLVGIGANGKWTSTGRKNGMTLILPYFAAFFDSSVFSVVSLISLLSAVFTCSGCSTGPTKDCLPSKTGIKKSNTPCDRLKGLFLTSCYLACVTHGISSSQDSSVASSAKISHRAMKTSRSSMGSPPDLH